MGNWIMSLEALVLLAFAISIWLYCCYKDFISDRREKKAIKQALKDAGYV